MKRLEQRRRHNNDQWRDRIRRNGGEPACVTWLGYVMFVVILAAVVYLAWIA